MAANSGIAPLSTPTEMIRACAHRGKRKNTGMALPAASSHSLPGVKRRSLSGLHTDERVGRQEAGLTGAEWLSSAQSDTGPQNTRVELHRFQNTCSIDSSASASASTKTRRTALSSSWPAGRNLDKPESPASAVPKRAASTKLLY